MEVFLRSTVHAVRIGDDLVFLDLARDQYLCWPEAGSFRLSDDRRSLLAPADHEGLVHLEEAGLLAVAHKAGAGLPKLIPPAHRDLLDAPGHPLTVADIRDLAVASLTTLMIYPRRSIADLVVYGARREPDCDPDMPPSDRAVDLVRQFHLWSPWTPGPAKCLLRSYLLLRQLRAHGFDSRWVFAVRTWPFGAHCWLQSGDVILDDACERLDAFHPILVV